MYKLMVVEDEDIVREGMVNLIDFGALGYEVVAVCENGRVALEQFYEVLPDVVLTDICMAEMDGFEFIGRVYSEQLLTKFIIITGHDDFSYMKKALKYKVTDYLLKPVIPRELRALLSEVKNKLDEEIRARVDLRSLQSDQLRADFLRRQNFFNKIVGVRLEEEVILRQAREVGVSLGKSPWCVLILDCPERESAIAAHNLTGDDQLAFMIYNVAGEFAAEEGQNNVFTDYYGRTLVLVGGAGAEEAGRRIAAGTVGYFKKTFSVRLQARMGGEVSELGEVNRSFEQASSLYLVECADEFVSYPEWERTHTAVHFPAAEFGELLSGALSAADEETEAELGRVISRMFGAKLVSAMDFDSLRAHVRVTADLVVDKFAALDITVSRFRTEAEGLDALKGEFSDWLARAREELRIQNSSKRGLMNRILKCIREHYRDFEFSGESVCKEVGVSTSTFSALFKDVTGTTFTKYLNAYRIDRAKELLRCSDKGVAEIAESVGYLNSAYFGLVFKNGTGFTPNAYRKRYRS